MINTLIIITQLIISFLFFQASRKIHGNYPFTAHNFASVFYIVSAISIRNVDVTDLIITVLGALSLIFTFSILGLVNSSFSMDGILYVKPFIKFEETEDYSGYKILIGFIPNEANEDYEVSPVFFDPNPVKTRGKVYTTKREAKQDLKALRKRFKRCKNN